MHGGVLTFTRMVAQTQETIKKLIKSLYSWIRMKTQAQLEIVEYMKAQKPKLHYHGIVWERLGPSQVKCNIDRVCIGNPGLSSYGFSIRDDQGDMIHARAKGLGFTTNTIIESLAIKEAMEYCFENKFKDFTLETDLFVSSK